jgi:hypothetical protein
LRVDRKKKKRKKKKKGKEGREKTRKKKREKKKGKERKPQKLFRNIVVFDLNPVCKQFLPKSFWQKVSAKEFLPEKNSQEFLSVFSTAFLPELFCQKVKKI